MNSQQSQPGSNWIMPLRVATGLIIVASLAAAGYLYRSPWIIAVAAPPLTALYALGKWRAWVQAWRMGGARQIGQAVLAALPVQAILAALLYLLGLGLGTAIMGPAPLVALSANDLAAVALVFAICTLGGVAVLLGERQSPSTHISATPPKADEAGEVDEIELNIDHSPLTLDTFYKSPTHWRFDAAKEALVKPGQVIAKPPLAATEEMIAAAEARFDVRFPKMLRELYGRMNGGYVGAMYVALKTLPGPFYDDWRGAFSIDYSSLIPVDKLRTLREHYGDFTDDPDEIPPGADRLIVLEARYGDMTLLDYNDRTEPRVLLVDYDKQNGDPIDIAFDRFDDFFGALRREVTPVDAPYPRKFGRPLAAVPAAGWARRVWGDAKPHPFHVQTEYRQDVLKPKLAADDELIAQTESKLGVSLPNTLTTLWRAKNGGGMWARYVAPSDQTLDFVETMRTPMPMECFTTLADLSDRMAFPAAETPWKTRHPGSERLVVIDIEYGRAVLLDYRERDRDPGVILVQDLDTEALESCVRYESFDEMAGQLRFQLTTWDLIGTPLADEMAAG